MLNLKELQVLAKDFSLLYVEDNEALQTNTSKLLRKLFVDVDIALDALSGLELFKKKHHPIVIIDIKMPNMDGMALSKHIKKISPETKIIIISSLDKKELLLKFIELEIFRFLKTTTNVNKLFSALEDAVTQIREEKYTQEFYSNLNDIFNYQSSMLVMLNNQNIILANKIFLEFFSYENLDTHKKTIRNLEECFLPHEGFFYKHDDIDIFESLRLNSQKIFHVKLKNTQAEIKHFILKYQTIPERKGYGILSFDDITELNLLKFFNKKELKNEEALNDEKAMFELLGVIQRNGVKIELHNYYKGLSITNDATIISIEDNKLKIKTSYIQEKAIQFEKKTLIVSGALPHAVECRVIKQISFDKQEVIMSDLHFISSSPITRKTIRVVPTDKQTVSLFLGANKFYGDIEIEDISLDAVKLKMRALPAGLDKEKDITLDIVLEMDRKPFIINTKVELFRQVESRYSFHVVFMFKDLKKSMLVKYITKRQMELIREIKGMQNG
ncbi:response regulator [Sulfurimonas sp. SAG-AH-194-L11]|nr:response regulator [Sulfurimonas sp. SAG-AH-194-L11]MDF1876340.1 response regulator [Sulfurimonas sp. SAG-AH-194-L11]